MAASILVVSVLGTLTLIDRANGTTGSTRDRQQGTSLARQLVEAARGVPYPELTTTRVRSVVAVQAGRPPTVILPIYRIVRGGTSYQVSLRVCTMDDAADGGGSHAAGGFCPGSAPAGTADPNAEDAKVVTAQVGWRTRGVPRNVVQKVLINDSGRSTAPTVTSLAIRGQSVPPGPVTSGTSLTLDFATSAPATPVWRVDGVPRTPAATGDAARRAFAATWSLAGVEDGVYSVSAHGLDGGGRAGGGRSLSVTLNRFVPRAPEGVTVTRESAGNAVSWQPSVERDVVGYTVYRRATSGAAPVAVCVREPEPGCTDPGADRRARYVVVASDLDAAGAPREGTPSAEVGVS